MALPARANAGGIVYLKVIPAEGEPVQLGGQVGGNLALITGFTFDDRSRGMDKATITIENRDLRWFDDPLFVKGNQIEVVFGYATRLSVPRTMKIRKITGTTQLKIEAYGRGSDFHSERITRTFRNVRVDQAVAEIAKLNGYTDTVISELGEVRERIQQSRETDAQWLTRQADRYGFEWWIDADDTFHFHPWDHDQTPQRTFTWRGLDAEILGEPKIETSILNRPARFKVKAIDHLEKRTIEVEAGGETERTSLGDATEVQDTEPVDRAPAVALNLRAWHSHRELQDRAEGAYRVVQSTAVKMEIKVIGDPQLQAKRLVTIDGMGTLLSGNYRVVRAVHTIKQGYVVKLILRRDAVGRISKKRQKPVDRANREKGPDTKATQKVDIGPRASTKREGMRFIEDAI